MPGWIGQTSTLGGQGSPAPRRRRPDGNRTANEDTPGAPLEPSWGPVGSLLKKKDPELYQHILAQHESMVALERSRKAADAQAETDPDANRTRNCPQCGVTFSPSRSSQRFCTEKCRKQSFRTAAGRHVAA